MSTHLNAPAATAPGLSDSAYQDHAEALLRAVERCCDRINDESDADIDNQRVGGMITLVFANKSQIVINLQKPLHEVWLAAKAGGFHYKWAGGDWRDTKQASEFFADLTRHASAQSGQALRFSAL
jgi:CyaY protein